MEILARIITFDDLRIALNARKSDLGLRNLDVDEIAGLQTGYSGKIFCGVKRPGDMSLPVLLKALGVELALVKAPDFATSKDDAKSVEPQAQTASRLKKVWQARSVRGGQKRWLLMTDSEKRKHLSKMHKGRIRQAARRREAQQNEKNASKAARAVSDLKKECIRPLEPAE